MRASYEEIPGAVDLPARWPERHSEARWLVPRTLRAKLAVAGALAIAVVIAAVTAVGLNLAERAVEDDLRETARVTALAVADSLEIRADPGISPTSSAALNEFLNAAPSVRAISVFSTAAGLQQFVAGTASIAPATPDALVERAVRLQSPVEEDRPGYVTAAAAPVLQDGTVAGVVLVTVSLAPVARLRAEGRVFAIGLALVSMLGLVGLIHLLAERLVHRPLRGVVNAVGRARRGDLSARATVFRDDEIGEVAVGLNTMLTELEELHQSLQQRVDAATRELRERNEQIVRSHESVLTLREALARAQALAAIGQTMANVAHQIGTPLNLVSAHVQLMQQESQDPAVRRRLQIVEDQIERVTSSVRALLDRARPYAIKRDVPLEPLLKRLVEGLQVQAAATGVTTQVDVAGPLPSVVADETQLELALLNLMANALDAMPGGGRLSIVAAASPDAVTIAVRDTGIGIPPGLSERMFEPWVTTKPPGQGTGLGLTITREVIERSGGTIAVENRAGGGTVFRVTLPRAEAKEYRP